MKIILDGSLFIDKETSYEYLIDQLALPEYTGYNLDALWDVLMDCPTMEIEIIHARDILDHLGDYGWLLLDVFGDLLYETDHDVYLRW